MPDPTPRDVARARELVADWRAPLTEIIRAVDVIARALAEERERCAQVAATFIARDLAAFNAGQAENPLWTTALAEACDPVLRQVAAAIRALGREDI